MKECENCVFYLCKVGLTGFKCWQFSGVMTGFMAETCPCYECKKGDEKNG